MKVILFGASGMVGQGVLREALADPGVEAVLSVGRSGAGVTHEKLRELRHADMMDLSSIEDQLRGHDACFFCLGISSAGMSEEDYRRVTYDMAMSVGRTLSRVAPKMRFVFVSGAGTDSSEKGSSMWARVKGKTENDLAKLPFAEVVMFRPGFIQPRNGIVSKTRLYRFFYAVFAPLYPILRRLMPAYVTATDNVGRAMLRVAREGAPKRILENRDINALASAL